MVSLFGQEKETEEAIVWEAPPACWQQSPIFKTSSSHMSLKFLVTFLGRIFFSLISLAWPNVCLTSGNQAFTLLQPFDPFSLFENWFKLANKPLRTVSREKAPVNWLLQS